MRDNMTLTPDYFLVYPDNRKVASGEMSFMEKSHGKLRIAVYCFVPAVVGALVLWLLAATHTTGGAVAIYLGGLVVILAIYTVVKLREAVVNRRLEDGQFIEGRIVSSKTFWANQGRGGSIFSLKITYSFLSPFGTQIERTISVQRQDLWKQAPESYKGFSATIRRWKHPEELQALAPEAGTPLRVRYVADDMFRVM